MRWSDASSSALAILVVAASTGPAQALAAAAVGAALAGLPVGGWCTALALATLLRSLAAYGSQVLAVRATASLRSALHARHGAILAAHAPHEHGRIAVAAQGRMQAVRAWSELLGLWLGAAGVLAWLDARLLAPWLATAAVVALVARRDQAAHLLDRAQRRADADRSTQERLIAAAPAIADLGLVGLALRRDRREHAAMRTAAAQAAGALRQPARAAMIATGIGQTAVAVAAAALAASGAIGAGGAIAAILATTTAAARCELLAGAAEGHAVWRLALRRLRRLGTAPRADGRCRGPAAVAIGGADGALSIQAGDAVALLGPAQRLEAVLAALRGAGGPPVLLDQDGRLTTPAADPQSWAAQVAVVDPGDRLCAGTLRANLDPAGRHDDAAISQALAQAGFAEARPERVLGCGGSGLSTGETARALLARAILAAPRVLVLADPTRCLDRATAARIHALIADRQRPWTVLVIGCDAATAAACGRISILDEPAVRSGPAGQLLPLPGIRCWLRGEAA